MMVAAGIKKQDGEENLSAVLSFGCPEQESNLHARKDTTP